MLVILIIGIAFIVCAVPDNDADTETTQTAAQFYGEEERLGAILSEIEGVGNTSVMITYVSTSEKDIVRDNDNGRAVTSGGDVVVKREVYPQVKGVIVIADGAGSPAVRQAIKEAVIAVTGAGANRVCVYQKEK